jgi:hypothetical protein
MLGLVYSLAVAIGSSVAGIETSLVSAVGPPSNSPSAASGSASASAASRASPLDIGEGAAATFGSAVDSTNAAASTGASICGKLVRAASWGARGKAGNGVGFGNGRGDYGFQRALASVKRPTRAKPVIMAQARAGFRVFYRRGGVIATRAGKSLFKNRSSASCASQSQHRRERQNALHGYSPFGAYYCLKGS